MMTAPNAYEERARANKAARLADTAATMLGGAAKAVEILTVVETSDGGWAALAEHAGCNPPSDTTRLMVLDRLRSRADIESRPAPADAFAGLG